MSNPSGSLGRPMTPEEQFRAIYGMDAPLRTEYASWGRRVLGYLIDLLFGSVVSIPLIVGYVRFLHEVGIHTDSTGHTVTGPVSNASSLTVGLMVFGAILTLIFQIWNSIIRQGRTGYSLGKTAMNIRLVRESTGQPVGMLVCFVRQLAHYIDSLACYVGWFWPLWDSRRQTLADKIMSTIVVVEPQDTVM